MVVTGSSRRSATSRLTTSNGVSVAWTRSVPPAIAGGCVAQVVLTVSNKSGGASSHGFTKNRGCQSRSNGRAKRSANNSSEEHTSELQSRLHLVCRLLLEKKK